MPSYFKWADQQLQELLAKNNSGKLMEYPKMQLGMASNMFNGRMPGAGAFENNVFANQATTQGIVNRNASDASQAISLAAGGQQQTNDALQNFQLQEADWKKFGLSNLNDAYGAMNEAENRQFENQVSLKGAQAANKFAKRKALWNTVSGIANFGVQAAGMIAGIPNTDNDKNNNGGDGVSTNWLMQNRPMSYGMGG